MKTEDLVRQHRRDDPQAVARALRDLVPVRCTVVDSRGRPVPLSSAGYVLRPNRSYRVRVIAPFADSELEEVKIVNIPGQVSADRGLKDVDEEGHSVWSIPFRVQAPFLAQARKLGLFGVRCEELEIACYFRKGVEKEVPPFPCPVVVRPWWPILVVSMLAGLIIVMLEGIAKEVVFSGQTPPGGLRGVVTRVATSFDSWGWVLGLTAGIMASACAVNTVALYWHSKKLRQQFRETYPS